MLTNLFSIFDPYSSFNFSMNWISLLLPMIFFPKNYWFKKSKYYIFLKMIIFYFFLELKKLFKKKNLYNIYFIMILFYMLLTMNFISMFPYIFTPTTHLTITLPLSLSIWSSMMIFFWLKKYKLMFAHLVPKNTPMILMPFMVLIESISNLIRPSTLAIRLSANMIAGHLLLCLLGSTGPKINFLILLLLLIQLILFTLEMAVSIIQSYVFITLSSLYSNEI